MKTWIAALAGAALLAGCARDDSNDASRAPTATTRSAPAPASVAPERLARGAQLFAAHCAACHGARAEGAPTWRQRGADGRWPAPPLDGSGHDWHHPYAALKQTIRHGTLKIGGSMPAWGGTLSEEDIESIILWFQSLWPEAVYRQWQQIDARAAR